MKRLIWLFLMIVGLSAAGAQEYMYIPDAAFRQYLQQNFPSFMKGDSLNVDSAAAYTGTIDCGGRGIQSLEGIQYFKQITELRASYNQLTNLPPLDSLRELRFLFVDNNQLTALPDLSGNTKLAGLWCNANQIRHLPDFGPNPALQFLICSDNQLQTRADLSAFSQLSIVYLQNNFLQTIILGNAPNLKELRFDNNEVVTLAGLENLTALEEFRASNNHLGMEDISALSGFPNLAVVDVSENYLEELPDFSASTALTHFYCQNNFLDFSDADELLALDRLTSMQEFVYAPQHPFWAIGGDTLMAVENLPATFKIAPQGDDVQYQWYKNGAVIPGATAPTYNIPRVSMADSGAVFFCRVTSNKLANMNFGPGITEFRSRDVYLIVFEGNDPPVFVTQNLPEAVEDVPYSFQLEVQDPENDQLQFRLLEGPAWLQVTRDGVLRGTPTVTDTGIVSIAVEVEDDGQPPLQDTLKTTLRVRPNPNPPQLTLTLLQNPVLPQFANLIISSDVLLKGPPNIFVLRDADSTQLAVTLLDSTDRVYRAKVEFSANGLHMIEAHGVRLNGRDTTVNLAVNAMLVKAPATAPLTLQTPGGKGQLKIPAEVTATGQVFLAWESGEIVHFSPAISSDAGYIVRLRYSGNEGAEKVFLYQLQGQQWVKLPSVVNPATQTVRSLVTQPGTFKAARDDAFDGSNIQPATLALYPNYPNPFNPSTTIAYDLAEDSRVTLVIYNLLGQKVRTLFEGFQLAGRYRFTWNGQDDAGQIVPGGVYFYQLRTPHGVLNKRMIYLR